MDLLGIFLISISQNIVLLSKHCEIMVLKRHYLGKKQGNFFHVIKAKHLSFHELRKFVASKEQHFV